MLHDAWLLLGGDLESESVVRGVPRDKVNRAKNIIESAEKLTPYYSQIYRHKGLMFTQLNKHEKALECFKKARHLEPTNSNFLLNIGTSYSALGKDQKAQECYRKLIENDEYDEPVLAYINLANNYLREGKLAESEKYYKAAIKIDPMNSKTQSGFARYCCEIEDWKTALEHGTIALKINPRNSDNHNILGVIYSNLNKNDKAYTAFQTAIELNPLNETARNNLELVKNKISQLNLTK